MDNMYNENYQPDNNGAPAPAGGKKKTTVLVAVGLVLALLMGLLGSAIGNSLFGKGSTTVYEGQRESSVIDVSKIETGKLMTPAEVYAANVNSTVGITTSVTTNYWGFQTTSAASGSGFILTADGYVLTNYHVIESSSSISVTLYDGKSYDATLIGYDESSDIAVLKIDAEGLTPVVLGDSDNLNVGDSVVAIGNPLGELTFSLTSGAVSALNREITLSNSVTMNLIQTDCAINSGNSGGALFNLYGEVIGITNAKYSGSGSGASIDNIGFAIPINHVRGIVESIIENGYVAKPYIGVTVSDVSEETMGYGLPAGAAVKAVSEDSPAEKAGLQVNDIITAVNGKEISGRTGLSEAVSAASVGDTLTLTVYRQGKTISVNVTVGEQIQSALANEDNRQSSQQSGYGSLPDFFGFGS
ncbi:MAG: trypsin-like peptidase domain-containing protein [Oscillospiraceae bacterium]|nr:trypsin-like peptidase domain-containing protein [Oscillospiraceae bacterium]